MTLRSAGAVPPIVFVGDELMSIPGADVPVPALGSSAPVESVPMKLPAITDPPAVWTLIWGPGMRLMTSPRMVAAALTVNPSTSARPGIFDVSSTVSTALSPVASVLALEPSWE